MADLKFALIDDTVPTSITEKTYTHASKEFDAKLAIFRITGSTTNGTTRSKIHTSLGVYDGTDSWAIGYRLNDGGPSHFAHTAAQEGKIALVWNEAAANIVGVAAPLNMTSVGGKASIKIDVTQAFQYAYRCQILLIGGDDFDAEVFNHNLGTSTSAQNVSLGFDPDVIFCAHPSMNFSTTIATTTGQWLNQVFTGPVTSSPVYAGVSHNTASSSGVGNMNTRITTDACFARISDTGVLGWKGTTGSHSSSTGFSVTMSASAGNRDLPGVAMSFGGASYKVGTFQHPTSTGATDVVTGLGFTPGLFFSLGGMVDALNTVQSDAKSGSVMQYMATADEEMSSGFTGEDGADFINASTRCSVSAMEVLNDVRTIKFSASFDGFSSGVVSLDYSTTDGTAQPYMAYLAVEEGSAGGVSVVVPDASISYSLNVPTVSTGVLVAVPSATISYQATVPNFVLGARVDVPNASIAYTLNVPVVSTGVIIDVPAASISYSLNTPSFISGAQVSVPSATIAYQLYVPDVGTGIAVVVPDASISYSLNVPTISAGESVEFTTGAAQRVYPRDSSGVATIDGITGTTTGTSTNVRGRIVIHGTSTEVVTWTNATDAGGDWLLEFTNVPAGAKDEAYDVEVRYLTDDASKINHGTKFWVGAVFAIYGNSHADRLGKDAFETYARQYESIIYTDDVASWNYATDDTGAAKLADGLADALDCPVALVIYAIGNHALLELYEDGTGYALDTSASSMYDNSRDFIDTIGNTIEGVFVAIGDADAFEGPVSAGEIETGLGQLLTNIQADNAVGFSYASVLMIVRGVQDENSSFDRGYVELEQGIQDAVTNNAGIFYGGSWADLETNDGTHTDEPVTAATRFVAAYLNARSISGGENAFFKTASWAIQSSTVVRQTLTHASGTDFTPTSGVTGARVRTQNSGWVSATGARVDATNIDWTHSGSGTVLNFEFGATANKDNSAWPVDNSTTGFALAPYRERPTTITGATVFNDVAGTWPSLRRRRALLDTTETKQISFAIDFLIRSTGVLQYLFIMKPASAGATDELGQVFINTNNQVRVALDQSGSGSNGFAQTNTLEDVAANQLVRWRFSADVSTGVYESWVNDTVRTVGAAVVDAVLAMASIDHEYYIGCDMSRANGIDGFISRVQMWNSVIDWSDKADRLNPDPTGAKIDFRGRAEEFVIQRGSGGDFSTIGTLESATLIEVPDASITYTLLLPSVGDGVTVNVPDASISYQTYAAVVSTAAIVDVPDASISYQTYVPAVSTAAIVDVPDASIAYQLYAPTVSTSAAINVPDASIAYQAYVPTVATGVSISVPDASISYQMYVPDVGSGVNVSVPDASITYQLYAPTVATGVSISVPDASISYQAYVPFVGGGVNVAVPSAAISYSLNVPSVITGSEIVVPDASISYQLFAPIVNTAAIINVPSATISYQMQVPTAAIGVAVAVPDMLIAYALNVPVITTGARVDVPATSISYALNVPDVNTGVSISVPSATIAYQLNIFTTSIGDEYVAGNNLIWHLNMESSVWNIRRTTNL